MTIKKHSLRNKQCTAIVDYGNFTSDYFDHELRSNNY